MPSVSIVVPLPKLPALRYGRLGRVIVGGGLRGMVYHATMTIAHAHSDGQLPPGFEVCLQSAHLLSESVRYVQRLRVTLPQFESIAEQLQSNV